MSKYLYIQIEKCMECPYHRVFDCGDNSRCSKKDKVTTAELDIPSWCPLSDDRRKRIRPEFKRKFSLEHEERR